MSDGNKWPFITCKECHNRETVVWTVPDDIWNSVTSNSTKTLCLSCFDHKAQHQGIKYKKVLNIMGYLTWEDIDD